MDVREAPMARVESGLEAKSGPQLLAIEKAIRLGQEVEQVRTRTKRGQRSAAESIEKSAVYHDRAAASYEKLAIFSECGTGYLDHATRHREFAREDRRMAQRLREISER